MEKPFAPACERNRDPIVAVLKSELAQASSVLEIGSGTGQHAVHFAAAMPHLVWQCSDQAEYLDGIRAWLAEAALPNTPPPLTLDVTADAFPAQRYDAVFSANTLHIMSWLAVQHLFAGLPKVLGEGAKLIVYGPFNYGGRFTSESNAAFDASLREGAPHRGIRDFEAVNELAEGIGLRLLKDFEMPANNRCLVWQQAVS